MMRREKERNLLRWNYISHLKEGAKVPILGEAEQEGFCLEFINS
jgi:hypothetical protein